MPRSRETSLRHVPDICQGHGRPPCADLHVIHGEAESRREGAPGMEWKIESGEAGTRLYSVHSGLIHRTHAPIAPSVQCIDVDHLPYTHAIHGLMAFACLYVVTGSPGHSQQLLLRVSRERHTAATAPYRHKGEPRLHACSQLTPQLTPQRFRLPRLSRITPDYPW